MARRFRKHKPTVRDGAIALRDHILAVAATARQRYGPQIDHAAILRIIEDREIVRYPVTLVFDDRLLNPGEFAFPEPRGRQPGEGFTLHIHPCFSSRPEALPMLIAYQIVRINYGDVASHEEAELFGSTLLGMDRDEFYDAICELADSMPEPANPSD